MLIFEAHELVGSFAIIFPDEYVGKTVEDVKPPEIPIAVPMDLKTIIIAEHIEGIIPLKVYSLELHNLIYTWLESKRMVSKDWQIRTVTEGKITRLMIFFCDLDHIESLGDMIYYCICYRQAMMN